MIGGCITIITTTKQLFQPLLCCISVNIIIDEFCNYALRLFPKCHLSLQLAFQGSREAGGQPCPPVRQGCPGGWRTLAIARLSQFGAVHPLGPLRKLVHPIKVSGYAEGEVSISGSVLAPPWLVGAKPVEFLWYARPF